MKTKFLPASWLVLGAVLALLSTAVGADSLGDQLIQDAKSGSLAGVQKDLANGANVNARHKNGRTALMLTAEWSIGNKDIADVLLAHGAEVDAKDNKGMTALMYAASVDNADVARVLLAHGANANAKANDGSTVLAIAQAGDLYGDGEVVGLLDAAGAH